MGARDVRPTAIPGGSGRVEGLRCAQRGCAEPTREGKPYCPRHVEGMPYVARLVMDLRAQQAEQERVRRSTRPALDPDGLTARELLLLVEQHGGRTVPRLAKDLQLEPSVVARYVAELRRCGRVRTGETRRGATTVLPVGRAGADPKAGLGEAAAPDAARAAGDRSAPQVA